MAAREQVPAERHLRRPRAGHRLAVLSGLFVVMRRRPDFLAPVRTLGQVALFYYLLHFHVMTLFALLTGMHVKYGVASAYLATGEHPARAGPGVRVVPQVQGREPRGVASVRVTGARTSKVCSRTAGSSTVASFVSSRGLGQASPCRSRRATRRGCNRSTLGSWPPSGGVTRRRTCGQTSGCCRGSSSGTVAPGCGCWRRRACAVAATRLAPVRGDHRRGEAPAAGGASPRGGQEGAARGGGGDVLLRDEQQLDGTGAGDGGGAAEEVGAGGLIPPAQRVGNGRARFTWLLPSWPAR